MKTVFSIIIIILLVGCKPAPIELEIPQQSAKPVLYSQYITDGYFSIWLTQSFGALERKAPQVDSNGIILDTTILYNNISISLNGMPLEELDGGFFLSQDAWLENGHDYTLTIYNNNTLLAQAKTKKIAKHLFDSVAVEKNKTTGSLSICYRIADDVTEENFYVINYLIKKEQDTISNKLDPGYIAKRMLQQNTTFDLLTDKDFTNGFYQTKKVIANNYENDTVAVSLSSIDKGFYNFLKTQKKAGTLVNQIKAEVINFPSNIIGGYGYFTLHEPDVRIINLK